MSKLNSKNQNIHGKIVSTNTTLFTSRYSNKINDLMVLGEENALDITTGAVRMEGGLSIAKDLYVKGKITGLGGSEGCIILGKNLSQNINIVGASVITGDLNVAGNLQVTGSAIFSQGLDTSGTTLFYGDLNTEDLFISGGPVTVNSTAYINIIPSMTSLTVTGSTVTYGGVDYHSSLMFQVDFF